MSLKSTFLQLYLFLLLIPFFCVVEAQQNWTCNYQECDDASFTCSSTNGPCNLNCNQQSCQRVTYTCNDGINCNL